MNEHLKNKQDELTWQAFQYVAGELSVTDADLFEERLADDQAAREAVAQAVALFHTVCAVEAAEPVVAIRERTSRRALLVPAITLALAICGGLFLAIAGIGVVRMPDLYSRMQAATKAATLGVGCMLLGVAVSITRMWDASDG